MQVLPVSSHRALDGSLVTVRLTGDLSEPFSSFLELPLGSHLQEFAAGELHASEASARDLGVRTFAEEYQFQDGTLRFGSVAQYDPTVKIAAQLMVAVWEGRRFSLFTHAYHAAGTTELLKVLNTVRIRETPEGLALVPTSITPAPAEVSLVKEVPGLGLLQIRPAVGASLNMLPTWPGRAVAGGELFLDDSGPDRVSWVLAGRTAVTNVVPHADRNPDDYLPALAELTVEWAQG
jgi:hypothetical protein